MYIKANIHEKPPVTQIPERENNDRNKFFQISDCKIKIEKLEKYPHAVVKKILVTGMKNEKCSLEVAEGGLFYLHKPYDLGDYEDYQAYIQ